MITRRRELGQWLTLGAIALVVLAAAYMLVAELTIASAPCACTEAPTPSVAPSTG